jgi:small GTP-binding protein
MPDPEVDSKATLRRLGAALREAVAARDEARSREVAMEALLALNEAVFLYERGTMFQIVHLARKTAKDSKPDGSAPPGSAAHVASAVVLKSARLEAELEEDAPNVLGLAEEIGRLLEGLEPGEADEVKRLSSAAKVSEETLSVAAQSLESGDHIRVCDALETLSGLMESGLGLVKTYRFKVCLLGEGAVGKTSLVRRFVQAVFSQDYRQTLGTSLLRKEVTMLAPDGRTVVRATLMVWDMIGHRRLHKLSQVYFQAADAGIAVCDLTRKETLGALAQWVRRFHETVGPRPVVILANKNDIEKHAFGEAQIKETAMLFKAPWLFTSARSGNNVEKAFLKVVELILAQRAEKSGVKR